MTDPVSKSDWNTEPFPAQHTVLSIDRTYSDAEMSQIRRGLLPEQMEDKWFIYFEGDTLHMHRSWTGYEIYAVRFKPHAGQWRIAEARVNRDPGQYKETDDRRDEELVVFLIDLLLLSQIHTMPSKATGKGDAEHAVWLWSLAGRALFDPPDSDEEDEAAG